MSTTAIIVAAGQGTRLGMGPKAFVSLGGASLVQRSAAAMLQCPEVDGVIVVVSAPLVEKARRQLPEQVQVVVGGAERADSVARGLWALQSRAALGPGDKVLIHDAARALVSTELISRVAREVGRGNSGVVPVVPVADTIKVVDGEVITATPERKRLRAAQTPQGFVAADVLAAHHKYAQARAAGGGQRPDFVPTDDASLLEWAGYRVVCVPGEHRALKITTPVDLAVAQAAVEGRLEF